MSLYTDLPHTAAGPLAWLSAAEAALLKLHKLQGLVCSSSELAHRLMLHISAAADTLCPALHVCLELYAPVPLLLAD